MNILSSMLSYLLNRVKGLENRMGGNDLPSGTNINNLAKSDSGWWAYDRSEDTGTFPLADSFGTIGHVQGLNQNVAMQVLRSTSQSQGNPIIYARFKGLGVWGGWHRYVSCDITSLTVNAGSSSYCDPSNGGYAYKKSGWLFFRGSLILSTSMPNNTSMTTVGTISGWHGILSTFENVPMQNGSSTILVSISDTGTIQIGNYGGGTASGAFRFTVAVPCENGYE